MLGKDHYTNPQQGGDAGYDYRNLVGRDVLMPVFIVLKQTSHDENRVIYSKSKNESENNYVKDIEGDAQHSHDPYRPDPAEEDWNHRDQCQFDSSVGHQQNDEYQ